MLQKQRFWGLCLAAGVFLPVSANAEERPLKSFPETARTKFSQGSDHQTEGRYLEAISAYQEAINLGLGEYPKVYLRIALCYKKLKNPVKVIESYSRFLEDFGVERSCLF